MIVDGGCKAIRKALGKACSLLALGVVAGQKLEFGGVGGRERVYRKLVCLQPVLPGFNEPQNGGDIQMFVDGGIFLEVGLGEFEQGGRGPQAVFLQVDERARELNEALIEGMFSAVTVREPELFEHLVGFEVKTAVEAFKKAEIMGVQILSLAAFDEGGNFRVLFGHVSRVIEMAKAWQ